jgi:RND family efflux transporter MFP subunit
MKASRLFVVVSIAGLLVLGGALLRTPARARRAPSGAAAQPAASTSPTRAVTHAPVQLDTRRRQLTGVTLASVERTPLERTLRAVGIVRYDETRFTDVNLKLDGWARRLFVDYTGQQVRKGQPLLTLYSPDLLSAENEYLLALSTRDTMRTSEVEDARAQADRLVESARQRLRLWDLPADELRRLDETRRAESTVTLPSPVTGFVIEKPAVEGMHVSAGQTLYKVADLSTVWIEGDFYEADAPFVRVGARANVTIDAWPGPPLSGRITYVYPFVDDKTRTTKARFAFANPALRLKPGMFANVELRASLGTGLTVPRDAVLDSGREQLVFVAEGDGYFSPRRVRTGHALDDRVEIVSGLARGDRVATGAAFFVDSESQLRAAAAGWSASAPDGASARQVLSDRTSAQPAVSIEFQSSPDPPRDGDNDFTVSVRDAGGGPMDDVDVTVQFYMAPMPSMNMPAMRSEARLARAAPGVYRGRGSIPIGGRWDVTVSVTRGGQPIASRRTTVVTR